MYLQSGLLFLLVISGRYKPCSAINQQTPGSSTYGQIDPGYMVIISGLGSMFDSA